MIIQRSFRPDSFLWSLNAVGSENMVRDHVDEWISSGYRDGVEEPLQRRLGSALLFELEFLDREDRPLSVKVSPDGTVTARIWQRHMLLPLESMGVPQAGRQREAEDAARFLLQFLDHGDLKHRIAKCTHPGCKNPYFIRKRLCRYYKRPARCPHHLRQAAGNRARQCEHEEFLTLVVKFWPQWTERKHPNRALWVAEQVNSRRKGTERRITQKWVSRNLDIRTGKVKQHAKG